MITDMILNFLTTIIPGVAIASALIALVPRKQTLFRIFLYIFVFIILRDSMTPSGLWYLGAEGFFWIRFVPNPVILVLLGFSSIIIAFVIIAKDPGCRELVVWVKDGNIKAVVTGLAGMIIVALPVIIIYSQVDLLTRGGSVPYSVIPAIFVFASGGNLFEEILFRGFVQGYIEKTAGISPVKSAVISGLIFGLCHVFLAYTVTPIGYPLLVFAVYEGLIASFVRMKSGVIAAAITHGGAIFIITSGLI